MTDMQFYFYFHQIYKHNCKFSKKIFYKKTTKKTKKQTKTYYKENMHITCPHLHITTSHPVGFSFSSKIAFMVGIMIIIIDRVNDNDNSDNV